MIIYKYRDWNNSFHKKIITENELFLSSPKDLNDPLDCRVPTDFSLLDSDEKKMIYAQQFIDRNYDYMISKGANPENEKAKLLEDLKDLKKYQEGYNKHLFPMQDDFFGILSLSSAWNDNTMWSHYSANHTGFVAGFDEQCLRNSQKFGKGGLVIYDDKFPSINPIDVDIINDSFKQQFFKSKHWEYEKEYRLAKNFFPNKPNTDGRKIYYDSSCLKEIILGRNISDENQNAIFEITKNKKVDIYRVSTNYNSFELTREKIN